MAKELTNKTIAKNTVLSMGTQIISLITSLVINLIVPKFIDEYQYAYWQIYILYASYVGILHFGILDGLVLRFSEYDYEELDKENYGFHFWCLTVLLTVIAIIGILIGCFGETGITRIQIILISFSVVTKNLFMFASYSFQITNRIKNYAKLVVRQRMFYGLVAIVLLLLGVKNFYYFCIADICADIIGFIYSIIPNSKIYRPKIHQCQNKFKEIKITVLAGITLMIANFSSNFIVGSSKMIVQNFWPALVFGQISFGFSITNLFLTFVMAVSVVLFPSLKRMEVKKLPLFYKNIRTIISPGLLIIMLFYYPGCIVLNFWLPKYSDSLKYAGILLPIIIYSTKVSLLTNNYLKAYRKERAMLILNVSCIVVELLGLLAVGYFLRNLNMVLLWTVLIIVVRSVIAESLVSKLINIYFIKENIFEVLLAILFIICTMKMELWIGFIVYALSICVYLMVNKSDIKKCICEMRI